MDLRRGELAREVCDGNRLGQTRDGRIVDRQRGGDIAHGVWRVGDVYHRLRSELRLRRGTPLEELDEPYRDESEQPGASDRDQRITPVIGTRRALGNERLRE